MKILKKMGVMNFFSFIFVILIVIPFISANSNYPWINTFLYENIKETRTYTASEVNFVADHYDMAAAHLQHVIGAVKARNADINIFAFTGLAGLSVTEQTNLAEFFNENSQYTQAERESVYLHFKCDTIYNDVLIPGCNLVNEEGLSCSGNPANGCSASSASNLAQARVPDPDRYYDSQGWKMASYNDVYKDYGVWRLKKIFNYYPQNSPVDGMWWDNILYFGSLKIENTIEYWGEESVWGVEHRRNRDYNNFFLDVTVRVEQETGRSLKWLGNVNGMYWIRTYPSVGPYTSWVRNNLDYYSPESWLFPIQYGESLMPSWDYECYDMREVWEYSSGDRNNIAVLTYNHPFNGGYPNPDERTKIFSIAKYYLVKNPYLYYGYSEHARENNFPDAKWNEMAEVNLGMPRTNPSGVLDFYGSVNTDRFFDWNNKYASLNCVYYDWGNVVMARHYENGLVLVRWKGNRCGEAGPECNSYVNPINYDLANPYGISYYIVNSDGSISNYPVNGVSLSTNEAAVLLNVCPTDQTVTGTCGCNGVILNDGEVCGQIPPEEPYCGDGICNENENCATCEIDCGICIPGNNETINQTVEVYQCNDGIDNDVDGLIDYPLDPGCSSEYDDDESDPIEPSIECTNECAIGRLTCLSETSFSRCGYAADNCLRWSSQVSCKNDYVCQENVGCVLVEIDSGNGMDNSINMVKDIVEGKADTKVYAIGSLAVIFVGLLVWVLIRKLFYNYNRW